MFGATAARGRCELLAAAALTATAAPGLLLLASCSLLLLRRRLRLRRPAGTLHLVHALLLSFVATAQQPPTAAHWLPPAQVALHGGAANKNIGDAFLLVRSNCNDYVLLQHA